MTVRTDTPTVWPKVVVATRNHGKLREIRALLGESRLAFELVTIDELAPGVELREDGDTFEENALAKARQAAAATGLPALADDSGLEVDALGGAPGVWSARYAGLPSDDQRNNEKLVLALAEVPANERGARYRCVAAFVDPARSIELVRAGACEGQIQSSPAGTGGFGYDPFFFVPVYGRTMAELSLDEKNGMSHRAAAFRALASALAGLAGGGGGGSHHVP
jgi:XTP/dITP diphosphohydrolase